jgi:hypothetical protein
MPAISFQRGFLDALLSGSKQQTTRRQTDRIKVGDVCNIYIEQRTRITEKMMRRVTPLGEEVIIAKILSGTYPEIPDKLYVYPEYYAHFLGKVVITEVFNLTPACLDGENSWARADGFFNIEAANEWFAKRYGEDWIHQTWTVIRWNGWTERYFNPE